MRHKYLFFFLISFSLEAFAAPKIDYFFDGDTVKILDNSTIYKLRLSDIDAPERSQIFGQKSRRALMQLCSTASIQVFTTGTDQYQRHLGKLVCNGIDANVWMIQHGNAWFYGKYSKDDSLARLQESAQQQKIGLWAYNNPTPPWEWRQKHPHNMPK